MLMKLTFIGADHEVTGSCHFLEVGDTKVLIDCGMEQGNNRLPECGTSGQLQRH